MADIVGFSDQYWMQYAIKLAEKAAGDTHPNPLVGAVLVDKNNQIISEGYHKRAGDLHAERAALTGLELTQEQRSETTLYITLEPCCTHGRTPPCTDIILEKGIQRVVVGTIDPNPHHQAKGIELLRDRGVTVITGVLESPCRGLNPIFNHSMTHKDPLIAVKTATTLDGKIATASGQSKWITGTLARENVMYWRKYFPAIGVGAGTALADDPSLTVRRGNETVSCPQRYIFDRSLKTLAKVDALKVFNDEWKNQTLLVTSKAYSEATLAPYLKRGIQVIQLPYSNDNYFPLEDFRAACESNETKGIYLEGGRSLISSLLRLKGIDYLFSYRAPKLFAESHAPEFAEGLTIQTPNDAPYIQTPTHAVFGEDILSHGPMVYPQ